MGIANRIVLPQKFNIDGTGVDHFCHGQAGTWKWLGAVIVPHATLAAHATNVQTCTLKKGVGGTAISNALNNDTDDLTDGNVAWTVGVARNFTVVGKGKDLEFGATDIMEASVVEGGTVAGLDATIMHTFEQVGGSGGDR